MPDQLARFYQDLDGDMDQLFLKTPNSSIAFIYKSLGCPYSLQTKPYSAEVEPSIPALKSEGWIMWSTIQLLLGPDEHSAFLSRAVERWDVVDPATGLTFPKVLPRDCFPAQPDTGMVAWYEGVSERLRKDAEREAQQRERQAGRAEHRRVDNRRELEETALDSRGPAGPALAYFRNPLYRHVDGRSSVVRPSRRPPGSPRQSIMDKAKSGAFAVGSVVRNVANPHLWDGPSSSGSSRERERRRKSVTDGRHQPESEQAQEGAPHTELMSPARQRRRRPDDDRTQSGSPYASHSSEDRSPRIEEPSKTAHQHSPSLRHSRSHDPSPSQREHSDYFGSATSQQPRRSSAFEGQNTLRPPTVGPSFKPSDEPPFAAQVAAYPSIERPRNNRPPPRDRDIARQHSPKEPRHDDRRPPPRQRSRAPYEDEPQDDRRGPRRDRSHAPYEDDPRDDRRGHRRGNSRPPYGDDPRGDRPGSRQDRSRAHFEDNSRDDRRGSRRDKSRPRHGDEPREDKHRSRQDRSRPPYDDTPEDYDRRGPPERRDRSRPRRPRSSYEDEARGYDSPDRRPASRRDDNRPSVGSDLEPGYGGPEEGSRGGTQKQIRFAEGVDGRQYPNEAPWK